MTSSADCDCWFLRLEGRHYEDCNKGHKNPPRAEPPAPRCECAPEIEYGVRRHDYDCPVRAAERARAEPPAPRVVSLCNAHGKRGCAECDKK